MKNSQEKNTTLHLNPAHLPHSRAATNLHCLKRLYVQCLRNWCQHLIRNWGGTEEMIKTPSLRFSWLTGSTSKMLWSSTSESHNCWTVVIQFNASDSPLPLLRCAKPSLQILTTTDFDWAYKVTNIQAYLQFIHGYKKTHVSAVKILYSRFLVHHT